MSTTAIILLAQTEKSFLFLTSMARPDGLSQGARDMWRVTSGLAASISRISEDSSRYVDLAGAIGLAEFGGRAEREGLDDLSGFGVDGGGVIASVVHGKYAFGFRLIADGVGILTRGWLAGLGERLEIEDGDTVGCAVGDETLVEIVGDGDAVNAVELRNGTDDLSGVGIDNFDAGVVGDVEAAVDAIHSHVIPASFAADFDLTKRLITLGGPNRGS
jgi:hypothetical protein